MCKNKQCTLIELETSLKSWEVKMHEDVQKVYNMQKYARYLK